MMPILLKYSWPGNVRELHNFCQRLSFYQDNFLVNQDVEVLIRRMAPNMIVHGEETADENELSSQVQAYEVEIIRRVVKETGSIRKAAAKLGVGKSTLARKLKNQ